MNPGTISVVRLVLCSIMVSGLRGGCTVPSSRRKQGSADVQQIIPIMCLCYIRLPGSPSLVLSLAMLGWIVMFQRNTVHLAARLDGHGIRTVTVMEVRD